MSNEREKLAREWAKDCQGEGKLPAYGIAAQAAAEHIMATTTEPTMADTEWDGDKHFLAGATLDAEENEEEMVMCGYTRDGEIYVVQPDGEKRGYWPMPCDLTPNGKRYELREVTAPEHPETLTTVEDYENAPEGTIVALQGTSAAWVKDGGKWKRGTYAIIDSVAASAHARTVLRKGWGE